MPIYNPPLNLGSNLAFTGNNTHAGTEAFNGELDVNVAFVLGVQSIALNASPPTISGTSGSIVEVTGSTAATTIKLPASPTVGQQIVISNGATANFTLDGNGNNIDGASTSTVVAGIGRRLEFTSTNKWRTSNLTLAELLALANTWAAAQTFSVPLQLAYQSFVQAGSTTHTISASAGGFVEIASGSGASYVLQLPATPATGMVLAIANNGANQTTLNGNGKNIAGSSTQLIGVGQTMWVGYNGTQWVYLSFASHATQTILGAFTLSAAIIGSSSLTLSGTLKLNAMFQQSPQTFAAGGTISATSGSVVLYTGAAGQTLSLPTASLQTGTRLTVKDMSGNGVIVGRNGKNIDGAATDITLGAYGKTTVIYDGTAWGTL